MTGGRSGSEARRRYNLVRRGLAEPVPVTTTLEQALRAAGLDGKQVKE